MDIKYATKLMKIYEELHLKLLELDREIDWPICARPDARTNQFVSLLERFDKDDEWVTYYTRIAHHLDSLIWTPPKDKTKP